MSLTAHKTYGPKGIGALFVRRKPRIRLEAQMHGGGHERGMRSGTLPTHQIVGMGEAYRIAKEEMAAENVRIQALHDRMLAMGSRALSRCSSTATRPSACRTT
jgi:cysteine desulfurase